MEHSNTFNLCTKTPVNMNSLREAKTGVAVFEISSLPKYEKLRSYNFPKKNLLFSITINTHE